MRRTGNAQGRPLPAHGISVSIILIPKINIRKPRLKSICPSCVRPWVLDPAQKEERR
jgi:hypothetical protein